MTINDYLTIYADDKSDQYHHLPAPSVTKKTVFYQDFFHLKRLIKIEKKC
ncbi:hypothetical protein [Leuconostoc mesenteroides]|nr:hypothetical protein [Leuconostoc mesenteroides]UVV91861.1 hypothetical protein NX809_06020 [Leuconostoc mesenteroides]